MLSMTLERIGAKSVKEVQYAVALWEWVKTVKEEAVKQLFRMDISDNMALKSKFLLL